jgi:elongation factor Ts
MAITAEDIKKLRDETGAGMMKAKEALESAGGDFDKAVEYLHAKGEATAAKKADRETRAGLIEAYVHGGRIGVLVEVNCETDFVARTSDFKEFVRDLSLQVAATGPVYLTPEDVPAEVVERERALYAKEAAGKPEAVVAKIVDGKLAKFYEQVCLTRQPFVKDPDITVGNLTTNLIAKLGENIVIRRFMRWELGEA